MDFSKEYKQFILNYLRTFSERTQWVERIGKLLISQLMISLKGRILA